jgi:hypothetical protein
MYLAVIILTMGILPIASILVEHFGFTANADWWALIGKWFVFWGVGVRLFTAGIRQVVQPAFTAEAIFEIKDKAARILVQELGFANLAIGLLAILTIVAPQWTPASALVGAAFYSLAAARHVVSGGGNSNEMIATVSDIFIFVVLAAYLVAISLQPD